jgi:uncharacterized protein (TIGR02145 family)
MKNQLLLLIFLFLGQYFGISQNKIALVIGNANYDGASLRNPVNDATDMASTLRGLGFNVSLKTNLNRQQLEDAIRGFGTQINSGDIALFYFSGHGVQVDGLNYLIPIGAGIQAENEVRYGCTEAGFVLDKMESAGSGMNIIILDACRDNPFKGVRSGTKGFAHMSAPTGSIISYSTAPGSVAYDGEGRNSPYTANLMDAMKTQGLKIEDMFKKVRNNVAKETANRQIPWESSSLMNDFYFKPGVMEKTTPDQGSTIPPISTSTSGAFTDSRDGKTYKWVKIGGQVWMAENLNYATSTGSWCYENKGEYCKTHGRLYDWKTAKTACPAGWRLPSDAEWTILITFLGGKDEAGGKMKEGGTSHWKSPNTGATNSSGFSGLPGGARSGSGGFSDVGYYGCWWSSTEGSSASAWKRYLGYASGSVYHYNSDKECGFSVRCLRD